VPDIVAGAFEKLMLFVYKDELAPWSMGLEMVIAVYYAGLLLIIMTILYGNITKQIFSENYPKFQG
jgi:hypothetical protein